MDDEEYMKSFWMDRPTFVTGATGLLGSHLVEELVRRGASVVCLVRDSVPASHFHRLGLDRKVSIVHGQVEDIALLERTIGEYEIETVFHLAAQTIVGTASRNPLSTWETNVRGTYNLMEACRRSPRVKRIVAASSDKAYGAQDILPYEEDAPILGKFPYDCSKSCTDMICASYFASYKLPVCVTRCGNLFGPGDLNWNRLVPGTIRSALREEIPVIRSDGTSVRDYLYVGDAVDAYLTLAEEMGRPEIVGEAFNFSEERPMTTIDMAHELLDTCGRPLMLDIRGEVSNEIHKQYLSSAKARRLLDWETKFARIEGLSTTVEWYRRALGVI